MESIIHKRLDKRLIYWLLNMLFKWFIQVTRFTTLEVNSALPNDAIFMFNL